MFATPGLIGARPAAVRPRAEERESGGEGMASTMMVPEGVVLRWSTLGRVRVLESGGIELSASGAGSKSFVSCQLLLLSLYLDCRRRGTGVKRSL